MKMSPKGAKAWFPEEKGELCISRSSGFEMCLAETEGVETN